MTVYLAEDDTDIRELVQLVLEDVGLDVSAFPDGPAVLDACRAGSPDLVVLDVSMPGMTGLDVARRLRADAATAGVKILMMTARARPTDVAEGKDAGADDYVVKPFRATELSERVLALLGR